MKMKQLLPIALLAVMMTPAVFATESGTASYDETVTIDVPDFIRITPATGIKLTAEDGDFSIDAGYTTMTFSSPLIFGYDVVANKHSQSLYLTATCPTADGSLNALGNATPTKPIIVFANTATDSQPDTASITSALSATDAKTNPNAIAIQFTGVIKPEEGSGAAAVTPAKSGTDKIELPITNGKYNLMYTGATTNVAKTFSTKDESGTYQAVVTLANYINP